MKFALPELTEHQIQNAIIGLLQYKGYYVQRLNAGKYGMGEGESRRFIQGVRAGTPDIMAFAQRFTPVKGALAVKGMEVIKTDLIFIEVKRPGNKPTPLQEAVMAELTSHGARCIVAHSIEEVEAEL